MHSSYHFNLHKFFNSVYFLVSEHRRTSSWTPWLKTNVTDMGFTEERFKCVCKANVPEERYIRTDIRSDSRYCAEEGRCNIPGEFVRENGGERGGRTGGGEGRENRGVEGRENRGERDGRTGVQMHTSGQTADTALRNEDVTYLVSLWERTGRENNSGRGVVGEQFELFMDDMEKIDGREIQKKY